MTKKVCVLLASHDGNGPIGVEIRVNGKATTRMFVDSVKVGKRMSPKLLKELEAVGIPFETF